MQQALGPDAPRMLYYKDLPAEIRDELWRRFIEALEPLRQAGKLGAVHFQFAPWLLRNRGGHGPCAAMRRADGGPPGGGGVSQQELVRRRQASKDPGLRTRAGRGAHHRGRPAGLCQLRALRVGSDQSANWRWCACTAATSETLEHQGGRGFEPLQLLVFRRRAGGHGSRNPARRRSWPAHMHVLFNTNYEDQGQVNARMLRQLLGQPADWHRSRCGNSGRLDSSQSSRFRSFDEVMRFPPARSGRGVVHRRRRCADEAAPQHRAISCPAAPAAAPAATAVQPAPPNTPGPNAEKEAAAKLAAGGWLILLDRGDWGRAWETASGVFRASVPLPAWMDGIPKAREPFGRRGRSPAGRGGLQDVARRPAGG